jgi:YD repeat-containing protein
VLGNQTQVSDAEGRVTRYRFDERRQVVEIATPQVI